MQVATRGHGPIVVTRRTPIEDAHAPVVLGIDAGAPARDAIDFAFTEAALRGVTMRGVYACLESRTRCCFLRSARVRLRRGEGQAPRPPAEALAGWSERYPQVSVERRVEHSLNPPAAMLAESSHAGLVMVGPHKQQRRQAPVARLGRRDAGAPQCLPGRRGPSLRRMTASTAVGTKTRG
jgi:hypothetical protein